jgi:hypothetical protein
MVLSKILITQGVREALASSLLLLSPFGQQARCFSFHRLTIFEKSFSSPNLQSVPIPCS